MNSFLKSLLILFMCVLYYCNVSAQAARNLLSGKITEQDLQTILIPQADWHPFPSIGEREEWNKIPVQTRMLYIKNGEQYLGKPWEQLSATLFLEFARNGNRENYQTVFKNRRVQLESLVMAEIFENKGRFVDDIANGLWAICEETFWGAPAHLNHQIKGFGLPDITDPAIDLYAAETGAMLAYVHYFLEDKLNEVSPRITERILEEENRRIINPYLERDFSWEGRGENARVNNWNAWINSNLLAVILFLEKDVSKRSNTVYQILQSIDVFINGYTEDGACDEGPAIWVHAAGSMFSALEILYSASAGKINLYNEPLIQKMGQYIYKAWIEDEYYINFADASAIISPDAGLAYRYGKKINDSLLIGFGAMLGKQQKISESLNLSPHGSWNKTLPNLFILGEMNNAKVVEPFFPEIWMSGREIMAARSFPDSPEGLYLAAKGGHNAENHNHNDVGNFIIYYDGKPVIIDIGIETFTKKTFGKDRYDIWNVQSQYHNLPTINGVQQKYGEEYKATNVKFSGNDAKVKFTLDISQCYPHEAQINYWRRNIDFIRNSKIILNEDYSLKNFKEPVKLNFMTPLASDASTPGKIILSERTNQPNQYQIIYDAKKFSTSIEKIRIEDKRLSAIWGNELQRIVLTSLDEELKGNYSIEFSNIQK